MTHEFLSIYSAKLMEYGLAILYLLLFVPFWAYVQGGRRAAARAVAGPAVTRAPSPVVYAPAPLRPVATAFHGTSARVRRGHRTHVARRAQSSRAAARRTGEA